MHILLTLMLFALGCLHGIAEVHMNKIDGWGQVNDPDRDCEVQLEGDRLVIEYGRGAHLLDAERGCKNAPRVLQKFAGEFSIQFTVDGDLPLPELNAVKTQAYVSGGLVVMQDDKNYIRFERASFNRQGIISRQIEADTKPRNTKE